MKGCTRYKVKLITGAFINSMSCLHFPPNHYRLCWKWAGRSRRSNERWGEGMRSVWRRRSERCVRESFSPTRTLTRAGKSVFIAWSLVVNIERILCVLRVFTAVCITGVRLPLWKCEYVHVMSEIWRSYQELWSGAMIDRRHLECVLMHVIHSWDVFRKGFSVMYRSLTLRFI